MFPTLAVISKILHKDGFVQVTGRKLLVDHMHGVVLAFELWQLVRKASVHPLASDLFNHHEQFCDPLGAGIEYECSELL